MNNWGFYFNQDRCIGCKTCVAACKNWNGRLRGDASVNVRPSEESYAVAMGERDKGDNYRNPVTGDLVYETSRKYYMKEDWRRVEMKLDGSVNEDAYGVLHYDVDKKYVSVACNHCEDPACIKVCPVGSIVKNKETGAVLPLTGLCISCGRCQDACPWGAPQFYDRNYRAYELNDGARPYMTKCTMCYDRITEGLRPACVAACWNRALDAGPMDELCAKYPGAVERVDGFNDDYVDSLGIRTKPNILFKSKS